MKAPLSRSFAVGSVVAFGSQQCVVVAAATPHADASYLSRPCLALPVREIGKYACDVTGHDRLEMVMASMVRQSPEIRIFDADAPVCPVRCQGGHLLGDSMRTQQFMSERFLAGESFVYDGIKHNPTGLFWGVVDGVKGLFLTCVCVGRTMWSCLPASSVFREPRSFGHIDRHLGNSLLHPRAGVA